MTITKGRKNARADKFVNSAADYQIEDDVGNRWTINAKDFPAAGEFRVYKVYGNVNNMPGLKRAVERLLEERDVQKRTVIFTAIG